MRLSTLLWGTLSISTVLAVIVTRPAKAETKIGVLAGFSGVSAGYGTAYRTGIELAPRKDGYSFIFEDDQFLPAKTISAFNKLVTIDKISSAFIGDTVTAQAVAPIARRNKIPLYVWASSSFEANEGSLTTRLWTTDEEDFDYATEASRELPYLPRPTPTPIAGEGTSLLNFAAAFSSVSISINLTFKQLSYERASKNSTQSAYVSTLDK
jgi:hypothetical protein